MSRPEETPITANEIVANNVLRLRTDKGWKQTDLAERLSTQTARHWDFSMISKAETGKRKFSPDELVALVRVFQIPLHELFLAEDDELVDLGGVPVRGDDFFQLVFWMPAEWRLRLIDMLYGDLRQGGTQGGHAGWLASRLREGTQELVRSGQLDEASPPGDAVAIARLMRSFSDVLGPEVTRSVFGQLWPNLTGEDQDRLAKSIAKDLEEGDEEE